MRLLVLVLLLALVAGGLGHARYRRRWHGGGYAMGPVSSGWGVGGIGLILLIVVLLLLFRHPHF